MTLEQRIKRRNRGCRVVKTGTVAVTMGATAATGILTAALTQPQPNTATVNPTVAPIAIDAATKTVRAKKPKPPKVKPAAVKPTPKPQPKPAKTSGS